MPSVLDHYFVCPTTALCNDMTLLECAYQYTMPKRVRAEPTRRIKHFVVVPCLYSPPGIANALHLHPIVKSVLEYSAAQSCAAVTKSCQLLAWCIQSSGWWCMWTQVSGISGRLGPCPIPAMCYQNSGPLHPLLGFYNYSGPTLHIGLACCRVRHLQDLLHLNSNVWPNMAKSSACREIARRFQAEENGQVNRFWGDQLTIITAICSPQRGKDAAREEVLLLFSSGHRKMVPIQSSSANNEWSWRKWNGIVHEVSITSLGSGYIYISLPTSCSMSETTIPCLPEHTQAALPSPTYVPTLQHHQRISLPPPLTKVSCFKYNNFILDGLGFYSA